MSTASASPLRFIPSTLSRKPPCRVVIARGNDVRAFHIRPRLATAAGIVGVVFGVLYFAATGYLVFRDDLLAASLAHQARLQQAYEDRIAVLRANIDRLTSRQLLNQEAFEAKLDDVVGKQAALDARQDIIAGLSQAARSAGLDAAEQSATPLPRPRPGDDRVDPVTTGSIAPDNGADQLASAGLRTSTATSALPASEEATRIGAVESSLDVLARDQVAYVEQMAGAVAERTTKITSILERIGQKPDVGTDDEDAVGGPFVPLDEDADPQAFRSNVDLITGQIDQFATLRRAATALPLTRPMPAAPITSGFGARMDPFLHRLAMHPGIDFRAPVGSPVRATAAGKIVTAQYAGGYGNMVEIDHGGGVVTRYGHLSRILTKVGDHVEAGALIGRTGSTGRSTGPHLHYEVRVNGRAIDPMTYIRAGTELSALL
jgi:murein DD-endopeptidase MepM/ murein hydrolase activator NlpD